MSLLRGRRTGIVIGLAVALSITAYLVIDAARYLESGMTVLPGTLVLSVALAMAGHLLNIIAWHLIARGFGLKGSLRDSIRIWAASRLGRYTPGKLPLLLIRARSYPEAPAAKVALATLVEQISSIAAATYIVLAGFLFWNLGDPGTVLLVVGAGILLTAAMHPWFLSRITEAVARLLRRPPIEGRPSYSSLLAATAAFIAPALAHGMSLFVVLKAMHPMSWSSFPEIAAAYFTAGVLGLLVVIVPAGLGVREGLMLVFMGSLAPKQVISASALVVRLVTTVTELLLYGTARMTCCRSCRREQAERPGSPAGLPGPTRGCGECESQGEAAVENRE